MIDVIDIEYETESGMYDESECIDFTENDLSAFLDKCWADEIIEIAINNKTINLYSLNAEKLYSKIVDYTNKNPNEDITVNIYGVVYA